MTRIRNITPSDLCARCGAPIGHIHVNLHRNEERYALDGDDLDVTNQKVLNSYCMQCGVEAARSDLEGRGFVPHDVDYENTRVCTSCGKARVNMRDWHPTYLIAINCFDQHGFIDTVEETVEVISCARCEAAHGPRPRLHPGLSYVRATRTRNFLEKFADGSLNP